MDALTFYVVRSKDGKYLRSKGYSGSGECWVTELSKAKVWTKIGGANGQVTFWAAKYPEYGVPDVISLVATVGEPLNQEARVKKALRNKALNEAKQELRRAQYQYDRAISELTKAKNLVFQQRDVDKAKSRLNAVVLEIETIKKTK